MTFYESLTSFNASANCFASISIKLISKFSSNLKLYSEMLNSKSLSLFDIFFFEFVSSSLFSDEFYYSYFFFCSKESVNIVSRISCESK